MRASSWPSTTPVSCEACFAAAIDSGVTNSPAVVLWVAAMSRRQTATVALWTFASPRAASWARKADVVMPPEHEPQILTFSLPVIARIASTACSSAATCLETEVAFGRGWILPTDGEGLQASVEAISDDAFFRHESGAINSGRWYTSQVV